MRTSECQKNCSFSYHKNTLKNRAVEIFNAPFPGDEGYLDELLKYFDPAFSSIFMGGFDLAARFLNLEKSCGSLFFESSKNSFYLESKIEFLQKRIKILEEMLEGTRYEPC